MPTFANAAPPSRRLSGSIRLFVATCLAIWISKTYALYGSHDLWSELSFVYVAAVGAVSSYQEILIAAALAALFYVGGSLLEHRRRVRHVFDTLVCLGFALVAIVNYVNAELLAKLGAPLTLPLIHYSDILASAHGRSALWAWTGSGILLLGLGIVLAIIAADRLLRRLLMRVSRPAVLAILAAGTASLVIAGVIRSPAPANLTDSGTMAVLGSLRFLDGGLPQASQPVEAPFSAQRMEPGLPRPAGDGTPIRNVIIVVLEAAAAQYLDLYGGTYGVTPRLRARSAESVIVENAYAQSASSTVALRTLLSGRYPFVSAMGAPQEVSSAREVTLLPRLLADAGLRTAFFHSSDTRFDGAGDLLAQSGFQTVRDYRHRECGDAVLEDRYSSLGNLDRCTFADLARWTDEQGANPFFAIVWSFQSHYPYFSRLGRDWPVESADLPVKRVREEKERYLGALAEADLLIEALIRRLEKAGRYRDTLIIVTSDHGQAFGQHGTYGNGTSLYEESVRIPLILLNPRLRGARRFGRLSGQVDIAPTILDVLGLQRPGGLDGVSLFAHARERPIHFVNMTADLVLGYRFRDRKVISNLVRGTTEVYDLARDPVERRDISQELDPQMVRREQAWLAAWANRVNARWVSETSPHRQSASAR